MEWKLGTELEPSEQRKALARFVYRMTFENIAERPSMADHMWDNGYRMSIISDAQWLASTDFEVDRKGKLSERHNAHCMHSNRYRTVLSTVEESRASAREVTKHAAP